MEAKIYRIEAKGVAMTAAYHYYLMEAPLCATPAEKSWMEEVSFTPVSRRSLSWSMAWPWLLSRLSIWVILLIIFIFLVNCWQTNLDHPDNFDRPDNFE